MYIDTIELNWEPEDILDGITITHLVTVSVESIISDRMIVSKRFVRVSRHDAAVLRLRTTELEIFPSLRACIDANMWCVKGVNRIRSDQLSRSVLDA